MDFFSLMGIKGPQPLAFEGELTAEETVKAEALRAHQVEIYRTIDSRKLIGLMDATDEDVAALQKISEAQSELAGEIWERADPGKVLRKAHFEKEMERVKAEMKAEQEQAERECSADCEDHDPYDGQTVEKISLLSRIKRFFA